MSVFVEVNLLKVVDSVDEARRVGQAVALVTGEDKGIIIRDGFTRLPLVEPKFDRSKVTFGRQEVEGTLLKIGAKIKKEFGIVPSAFGIGVQGVVAPALESAPEQLIAPMVLDRDVRTWNVDYKRLTELVRIMFPGDVEKLAAFRVIVSEVLAEEALRGISFK